MSNDPIKVTAALSSCGKYIEFTREDERTPFYEIRLSEMKDERGYKYWDEHMSWKNWYSEAVQAQVKVLVDEYRRK
jgi:hypothetical protein